MSDVFCFNFKSCPILFDIPECSQKLHPESWRYSTSSWLIHNMLGWSPSRQMSRWLLGIPEPKNIFRHLPRHAGPFSSLFGGKFWDAFTRQESTCIYDMCFLQKNPSINDWKTRFPDGDFFLRHYCSPFYGRASACHHRGFSSSLDLWICGKPHFQHQPGCGPILRAAEALHLRNPRCGFATKTMMEVNTLRWRDSKIMMILFWLWTREIGHQNPTYGFSRKEPRKKGGFAYQYVLASWRVELHTGPFGESANLTERLTVQKLKPYESWA